jgi:hypothetical protein
MIQMSDILSVETEFNSGKENRKVTNTQLLRKAIDDAGLKISAIMEALGIKSYTTMREKIDNVKNFTAREIIILCELLNLTEEQREQIFFTEKTELYSA